MDQRFLVFAIVVVPVLTVCFGFTVHYVARPMVESLVDAIRDLARLGEPGDSAERIALLEAEVHDLREEVLALRAAAAFDRELQAERAGSRLGPGSDSGAGGDPVPVPKEASGRDGRSREAPGSSG